MLRLLWILFIPVFTFGQTDTKLNPYGLPLTNTIAKYTAELRLDPDNELVDLSEAIPGIILDIRYATANNFTNDTVYELPKAYVRKPVAKALADVQKELGRHGMAIKIFDAYRPYQATLRFWELVGDTDFVAAPWSGSRHNRGAAIDLTLVTLKTLTDIGMPTEYDAFSEKASPYYNQLPEYLIANRDFLIKIMSKHGFRVFPSEWWHFDYKDWEKFSLVDISFSQLSGSKETNK